MRIFPYHKVFLRLHQLSVDWIEINFPLHAWYMANNSILLVCIRALSNLRGYQIRNWQPCSMQRQILQGEVGGYWKLDWVLDILQWEEERSVLHCHGNCSGVSPPSLSVGSAKRFKWKAIEGNNNNDACFWPEGRKGEGRWGADSGVAAVTPQKSRLPLGREYRQCLHTF